MKININSIGFKVKVQHYEHVSCFLSPVSCKLGKEMNRWLLAKPFVNAWFASYSWHQSIPTTILLFTKSLNNNVQLRRFQTFKLILDKKFKSCVTSFKVIIYKLFHLMYFNVLYIISTLCCVCKLRAIQ